MTGSPSIESPPLRLRQAAILAWLAALCSLVGIAAGAQPSPALQGQEPAPSPPAMQQARVAEPEEAPSESALPLPPPTEIVAAYVEAVGGEEALRVHTSMKAKGVFDMPSMGLAGALEILSAAPNRLLVRVDVPGIGEILQGSDGEVAWSNNPMTGPALMEGEARTDALRQADFYAELGYASTYPEMETVSRTVLDDLDALEVYKVRLVDTSGKQSFHYFAVDSGLLVATEGEQDTPMGRVFVSTRVGRYEEFGGRLLATELRQSTMGMEQTMTIEEVEFDGVDDQAFALPETIRALLE